MWRCAGARLCQKGWRDKKFHSVYIRSSLGKKTCERIGALTDLGHSVNQSIVQQLTRDGNIRHRARNASPTGDMHSTTWRLLRTRPMKWLKIPSLWRSIERKSTWKCTRNHISTTDTRKDYWKWLHALFTKSCLYVRTWSKDGFESNDIIIMPHASLPTCPAPRLQPPLQTVARWRLSSHTRQPQRDLVPERRKKVNVITWDGHFVCEV